MSARHFCLASAIAVVLAGCAVTAPPPPEEIRKDALQGTGIRSSWSAGAVEAGAIADYWLASFDDPQLNALVDEAFARNPDLRAAAARVEQSAAYADIARAALLPSIGLVATGGLKVGGGSDLRSALRGVMLGISWEPDLWGRLR
jgi:outer membrane protein TolC